MSYETNEMSKMNLSGLFTWATAPAALVLSLAAALPSCTAASAAIMIQASFISVGGSPPLA